MKQTVLVLGLLINANIFSQEVSKIDYQLNFGTIITIPYKKNVDKLVEYVGHPKTEYNSGFGFFSECSINYRLNKNFFLNPGINYNLSILNYKSKIGISVNKGDLTSSYIGIPILVKYKISDNVPVFLIAGPYFGFLINAKAKGTEYADTSLLIMTKPDSATAIIRKPWNYNQSIKEDYKTFDIGVSIQIDYNLKVSEKFNGVIFTRFNYGVKNIMKNDFVNMSAGGDWKNYSLMIGLGLNYK
jgi:hypothetical protein